MTDMIRIRKNVGDLRLDPHNPRLPEDHIGASQVDLLKLFYADFNLDELASSYVENGFFEAEALIVQNGVVVEGNRRLAALKYLLHDADAEEAELPLFETDEPISEELLESLKLVPVYDVPAEDDLSAYLGFHHINGPLQWAASSKARYITMRVDKVAGGGHPNPFSAVAKEIGSNVQGVRNAYRQYALLRVARDDLNLRQESAFILKERFGVWARLTNANSVFDYIGFLPNGTDYTSIHAAIEDIDSYDRKHFKLLLDDLTPSNGSPALLNDSRRASIYTNAISNPKLIETLRETRDFELVQGILNGSTINERLRKVLDRLNQINGDVISGGIVDSETVAVLDSIERVVIGMRSMANAGLHQNPSTGEADA